MPGANVQCRRNFDGAGRFPRIKFTQGNLEIVSQKKTPAFEAIIFCLGKFFLVFVDTRSISALKS